MSQTEIETSGQQKKAGIYRHKDTGVQVELEIQPKLGTPLINAYERMGFVYVGPKPEVMAEVVSAVEEEVEEPAVVEEEAAEEPVLASIAADEVAEDKVSEYSVKEDKNGKLLYWKSGKRISKEEYDQNN